MMTTSEQAVIWQQRKQLEAAFLDVDEDDNDDDDANEDIPPEVPKRTSSKGVGSVPLASSTSASGRSSAGSMSIRGQVKSVGNGVANNESRQPPRICSATGRPLVVGSSSALERHNISLNYRNITGMVIGIDSRRLGTCPPTPHAPPTSSSLLPPSSPCRQLPPISTSARSWRVGFRALCRHATRSRGQKEVGHEASGLRRRGLRLGRHRRLRNLLRMVEQGPLVFLPNSILGLQFSFSRTTSTFRGRRFSRFPHCQTPTAKNFIIPTTKTSSRTASIFFTHHHAEAMKYA